MSSFPALFGESSHGKRKVWRIRVEERDGMGVIVTEHGYEDGKMVSNERVIEKGKNLGKKNETTAVQQAISEAKSAWNKKKDAAYAPDGEIGAAAGGAGAEGSDSDAPAAAATAVPLPMLAHDYNKRGKSIVFPCYAQKKLDGVRCVATKSGLFSRNGKAFPHLEHIRDEIKAIKEDVILDGELYSDELTFQEIVGLVKKTKLTAKDSQNMTKIHLCVYDVIQTDVSNKDRLAFLTALFAANSFRTLRMIQTDVCEKKEDMKAIHDRYVAEGYEGIMLRNMAAVYRVKVRCADLQKYKEFEDAEYKVVGFKEGDGLEKGCVIWICQTAAGQEFAVRPRGTHESRAALMADAGKYVGKELTVRYQELTTDGIPRFPVGISFRDYE
jgi:ATP-dependent DNA ligase